MVLNKFRYLLPKFINKPVNFCVKHNITPNQISIMGFLLSSAAAVTLSLPEVFFYNYTKISEGFWWWWACVPGWLFFLGAYVDALDGSVARETGLESKFGGFFDSTLDRLSDAVVVVGILFSQMIWPWDKRVNSLIAFIALSVILLISYARSRAEIEGVIMKGVGFMERAERVFILLGGYSLAWCVYAIEEQYYPTRNTDWVFPTFYIFYILLCAQTLFARVSWTYKWLNGKVSEEEKQKLRQELKKKKEKDKNQNQGSEQMENPKKQTDNKKPKK